MNRWIPTALLGLSLLAGAALAQGVQATQGIIRTAPKDVRPAIIAVSTTPPIIKVDGKEDRLSPGARVRDRNNMLVLSGALAGQTHYTVYRRDSAGLVHEVWLLSKEEYTKLGGTSNVGTPDGYRRFLELLDMIWAARALLLK